MSGVHLSSSVEPRIDELESRLAFLDDTVEQLNAVVVRQDQEIQLLRQRVSDLVTRLDDLGGAEGAASGDPQFEIPPHY